MIKIVIFDADGVIINGKRFGDILERDYSVDKEKEHEFFSGIFQDCLIGKADLKQSVAPYLPSFGWKGTVDEFLEYWFTTEYELNQPLIAYIRTLRERGIWCVLATNNEKYRVQYMLEHMGFDGVFDKVYASAHLGLKKPAVEFFAKVVQDMQALEDEVVFWDDDQENIAGAQAYGIHAEFYTDYDSFTRVMKEKYAL